MISYPFESQNTGTSEAPIYDRAISAQMERDFNKLRYTTGVFQTPVNGLQVVALPGNGMKVTVRVGGCHIEGAMAFLETDLDITIADSSSSLNRIDRIVARFDTSIARRSIDIVKKEGVPASNPAPLELTQQPNYYEIALADIYVKKGALEITNSAITDQRLNSSLCGLVVPAIPTPLDFTELYSQYQSSLDEYMALVDSALDGTTAGLLQGQIGDLETAIAGTTADLNNYKNTNDGRVSVVENTVASIATNMSKTDLLWTNPSPNSSFSPQSVNLELSQYDAIEVTFKTMQGYTAGDVVRCFRGASVAHFAVLSLAGNAYLNIQERSFSFTDTQVGFQSCINKSVNSSTATTDNNKGVPLKIYGVKF